MIFMILICTLPERAEKLRRLIKCLDRQLVPGVSYKFHDAGRSIPTGRKRNMLVEQTESEYFSFIDDDDFVSSDYVAQMTLSMLQNPDVITFNGWMTTNGINRQNFTIKLGSKYEEKNGHYYRFPNHLCAFKRDKVRHIKFPDIYVQEDYQWAKTIHDRRLLKTEVHIEADLYHYQFETKHVPYRTRIR